MKRIFDEDSFGWNCPTNWEEIADFLNETVTALDIADDPEAIARLWDDYCMDRIPNAPASVFDD